MKRKLYLVQCIFLLVTGAILTVLTFTFKEKNYYLDISKTLYLIFSFLFQLENFVLKNEKIKNIKNVFTKKR